ncbi:MAG: nicotinate (nicotinamide) nucleotide adenylyltransferase [Oscillospiraceae bacterium]|nr:nicotinate (nicotinamide) nucleotide adenylyltransferase [Oscillospiraceae bacterium]
MKIAMFGGSFNPPHLGHVEAVRSVIECLKPDRLLIMPAYSPPHKVMAEDTPSPEQRLELCRLAFADIPQAEISDLEIRREGKSYTADTLLQLHELYPDDELVLIMGTDMILSLESWYRPELIMELAEIAVLLRGVDEDAHVRSHIEYLQTTYGARITQLEAAVYPAASTEVRQALKNASGNELLPEAVYEHILRARLYDAKGNLDWLRKKAHAMLKPKRIPHVIGCEQEAVRLAKRWGEDEYSAAAAGILHDITKKLNTEEQLILCEKYDIIIDMSVPGMDKTLHQLTGAAVAYHEFGVSEAIRDAIRWHTTGKPEMTTLEKIIYLADYIEPNRCFDGVERIRALSYESLDAAMEDGLRMTMEDLQSRGSPILDVSRSAYNWFKMRREGLF